MKINENNIESLLFDYAEGNLTQSERTEIEKYLQSHSEYSHMLEMYDSNMTIEKPSEIIYNEKEELYRQVVPNKRTNIVLISKYIKWASSVAAAIVLFWGIKTYFYTDNAITRISDNTFTQTVAPVYENKEVDNVPENISNTTQVAIVDSPIVAKIQKEEKPEVIIEEEIVKEEELVDAKVDLAENIETIIEIEEELPEPDMEVVEQKNEPIEIHEYYTTTYQSKTEILGDILKKDILLEGIKREIVEKICFVASTINKSKIHRYINSLTEKKHMEKKVIYRNISIAEKENV